MARQVSPDPDFHSKGFLGPSVDICVFPLSPVYKQTSCPLCTNDTTLHSPPWPNLLDLNPLLLRFFLHLSMFVIVIIYDK
ncbi:hypothetical protein L873DRAFT_1810817 [Choiromyces venosus 120613-1]|uniref:Uncharacterized protein n=1 Tax=Choiromyces venosus 120613-1 TaxID=1336337 RepID=A0A3N4JES6_9PEZI|nr:hypothetical protein L873DRAFT_1810817 [Choiromyces venosus 120613-1]